jgi:hypothetical protein
VIVSDACGCLESGRALLRDEVPCSSNPLSTMEFYGPKCSGNPVSKSRMRDTADSGTKQAMRRVSILFLGCTVLSLALAAGLPASSCESCLRSALADALPWIGTAFYAVLFLASRAKISQAVAFPLLIVALFSHGVLLGESLEKGLVCIPCVAIGALCLAASILVAIQDPGRIGELLLAAALGILCSRFGAIEAMDRAVLLRQIRTSELTALPPYVRESDLQGCSHYGKLGVMLFEDGACANCSTLNSECLPILRQEFKDKTCIHYVKLPAAELVGSRRTCIVLIPPVGPYRYIRGVPDREDFGAILRALAGKH